MNHEELREFASHTYIFLLHHPVLNREGKVITTAVTNLDIHDISRASRTYGLGGYYLVTPIHLQQELVHRVIGHWQEGYGASHNPRRKEAFDTTRVAGSLDEALQDVSSIEGRMPVVVATSAREHGHARLIDYPQVLELSTPVVLLLGTGWGLHESVLDRCDALLKPVRGPVDYNHLSVRSAASIILDRIFGLR